jgi:hypothetical protein
LLAEPKTLSVSKVEPTTVRYTPKSKSAAVAKGNSPNTPTTGCPKALVKKGRSLADQAA